MAAPKLPLQIKQMLASEGVRTFHQLWHLVRSEANWNRLPEESREQLREEGWKAPRFEQDAGAGIDFLYMHRVMIQMVDEHLHHFPGPYHKVEGWNPIPFQDNNADYPVPPNWPGADDAFATAKHPDMAELYKRRVAEQFRNDEWLRSKTLDEVGSEIEWTVHGWMHLRWSQRPAVDIWAAGVENDWLGAPFSSHVNDHFWKLHGWIDETIGAWERANNKVADLSVGWSGPTHGLPTHHAHSADPKFLKILKVKEQDNIKIMTWKIPILEGVNEKERIVKEVPLESL